MSLTYAKNTFQLVNWGLSVGDVAVLSGAGRGVITWLTAPHRDKSLLDFLNTVPTELGMRKGLVDPDALNRRWGRELSLFHNGRRYDHSPEGPDASVENMDRFTWTMVIIVVCLDQAVSNYSLENIVLQLCLKIFMDNIHEIEFLQHEIPLHIQGWRSIGCVRKMTTRAASHWESLERDGHRLPGFIPENDSSEVIRFLEWLTIGKTPTLATTSSDVFSLAMLLKDIGIESLRTGLMDSSFDEGTIAVTFDVSAIPKPEAPVRPRRSGMRIPLEALSETVSLWPGTADQNNRRRHVFSLGQRAAAGLRFHAVGGTVPATSVDTMQPNRNISIAATACGSGRVGRLDPNVYVLASKYLLLITPEAMEPLTELVKSWKLSDGYDVDQAISTSIYRKIPSALIPSFAPKEFGSSERKNVSQDSRVSGLGIFQTEIRHMEIMGEFQIFTLGYFYTALQSVIDMSQMTVKEAIGSWGWYDLTFMGTIRDILEQSEEYKQEGRQWRRHVFFQLIAVLYAGADNESVIQASPDTVGFLGKLAILSPGLLGDADTPERVCKFYLLDIDATGIPSNNLGIVSCSPKQPERTMQMPLNAIDMPEDAAGTPSTVAEDFTSHIEPAWGYDVTYCTVAFRHKGRLVHKIDSVEAEIAVLSNCSGENRVSHPSGPVSQMLDGLGPGWKRPKVFQALFHEFYGSNVVKPQMMGVIADEEYFRGAITRIPQPDTLSERVIVFVPSQKMRRARFCISSLYTRSLVLGYMGNVQESSLRKIRDFPWHTFSEQAITISLSGGEGLVVIL